MAEQSDIQKIAMSYYRQYQQIHSIAKKLARFSSSDPKAFANHFFDLIKKDGKIPYDLTLLWLTTGDGFEIFTAHPDGNYDNLSTIPQMLETLENVALTVDQLPANESEKGLSECAKISKVLEVNGVAYDTIFVPLINKCNLYESQVRDIALGVLALLFEEKQKSHEHSKKFHKHIRTLRAYCDVFVPQFSMKYFLSFGQKANASQMHEIIRRDYVEENKPQYMISHISLDHLQSGMREWDWDFIGFALGVLIKNFSLIPGAQTNRFQKQVIENSVQLLEQFNDSLSIVRKKTTELLADGFSFKNKMPPIELLKNYSKDPHNPINLSPKQVGTSPFSVANAIPAHRGGKDNERKDEFFNVMNDIVNQVLTIDRNSFELGLIADKTLLAHYRDKVLARFVSDPFKLPTITDIFASVVSLLGEECDIDEGMGIIKSLSELSRHEPLMYWGIKRYRDHVKHCCRVALLGHYLLDQELDMPEYPGAFFFDESFREKKLYNPECNLLELINKVLDNFQISSVPDKRPVPQSSIYASTDGKRQFHYDRYYSYVVRKPSNKSDKDFDNKLIRRIWLITALKHDIGYILTYIMKLVTDNEVLADINPTLREVNRKLLDTISDMFEHFRTHASSIGSSMYRIAGKQVPHGVVSAFHVQSLPEFEYVIEVVSRACARHDDDTKVVIFEEEPISWLLILIDELQEWGRPVKTSTDQHSADIGTLPYILSADTELLYLLRYYEEADEVGLTEDQKDYYIIPPSRFDSNETRKNKKGKRFLCFEIDYDYTSEVLFKKTQFSFLFFFLLKQKNLCRLRGGPMIKLKIKITRLVDLQFKSFIGVMEMLGRKVASKWARQIKRTWENGCHTYWIGQIEIIDGKWVSALEDPPPIDDVVAEYSKWMAKQIVDIIKDDSEITMENAFDKLTPRMIDEKEGDDERKANKAHNETLRIRLLILQDRLSSPS
jgi:hypothetical protein